MTNWDQRAAFAPFTGYAESQIGEGGTNATDNCVPTSFSLLMMVLGYGDIEPQVWTDYEYGTTYHDAEDYGNAIDFATKHYPNCPAFAVTRPADPVAAVDGAGVGNMPMAMSFTCDSNANIIVGGSVLHVSPVIGHVGGTVYVLNVWHGVVVSFDEATFRAVCSGNAGWLAVAQRALPKGAVAMDSPYVDEALTSSGAGTNVLAQSGHVYSHGDAKYQGGVGVGTGIAIPTGESPRRIQRSSSGGYVVSTVNAGATSDPHWYAFGASYPGGGGAPDGAVWHCWDPISLTLIASGMEDGTVVHAADHPAVAAATPS